MNFFRHKRVELALAYLFLHGIFMHFTGDTARNEVRVFGFLFIGLRFHNITRIKRILIKGVIVLLSNQVPKGVLQNYENCKSGY